MSSLSSNWISFAGLLVSVLSLSISQWTAYKQRQLTRKFETDRAGVAAELLRNPVTVLGDLGDALDHAPLNDGRVTVRGDISDRMKQTKRAADDFFKIDVSLFQNAGQVAKFKAIGKEIRAACDEIDGCQTILGITMKQQQEIIRHSRAAREFFKDFSHKP